jgi:class 3 adenylate cyclase
MQRFKGALLFIDISGFTVLSQKLDIESLKNNINDYFTKMLTTIQKWGGDVIKFAGDALYIVWQVREGDEGDSAARRDASKSLDLLGDITFPRVMSSREAVDRATSCALDICATCSNYEVKVQVLDRRGAINAFQYKSASAGDSADDVTYLDVHAGLSFGTMAGIDIGTENRWEYFLAGSPLADVAAAEEKAKKGDVVICKEAHALWHGVDDTLVDDDGGKLLCGCRLIDDHFYLASKTTPSQSSALTPPLRRKSSRGRLTRKEGMKDILTHGTRMQEDFSSEIELIYEKIRPMLELLYMKIVLGEAALPHDVESLRFDFEYFYENECRRKFTNWMIKAMTDELAKHVHDVERKNHAFHELYLKERYYDAVHHSLQFDRNSRSETISGLPSDLESQRSYNTADQTTRELGVDLQSMFTDTRMQKSSYHNVFGGSNSIAAEIFLHSSEKRSLVTVMFVKIESITIEITEYEGRRDHHDEHHLEQLLGFIPRTVQEFQDDSSAIERLQRCFSVLHEAIYSTEGQLRQFIIDDKGTVCIATFGLMGAVSVDNAASAIACAEKIILGLEGIDLNARIGVTTGEAYCGVVGSSIRHEYAVMGPSTNLSARLMCRAEARSIICDETTYGQDRANKFILLDELKDVKGYSHPVKIFQPRSSVDLLNSNLIHDVTGKSGKTVRSAIITSKFVKGVYNVMKKVRKNVLFNAKIAKSRAKIREIIQSEFVFLCEDRLKSPINGGFGKNKRRDPEKTTEVYRLLHGRQETIKQVFEAIIPAFGTIQNVIFEIDSLCRMVVIGSSVGGGKSAILSGISLKLQKASEKDPQLNFFLVSDNTFSKLRLKATVPLSYWGFILFDLLKIVATNFQMTVDSTLPAQEQSRLRYMHTFDSLWQQLPENIREPKNLHLLMRLMKLENSTAKTASDGQGASTPTSLSTNHHFVRDELEILTEVIVHFVDLIPKVMNCAMILVLDDAHFLDSWSLKALHEVWLRVKGVCMVLSFNPTQYHSSNIPSDSSVLQESFYHSNSSSLITPKNGMRASKSVNITQSDIFAEYSNLDRFQFIELPALKFEDTKLIAQDILGSTMELNEAEFRQLFDISNGNPLYTVELMYAIVANGGRPGNATPSFSKTNKTLATFSFDSNGNVISTPTSRNRDLRVYFNKSKRLEEVIYYRLDQLHSHAQVLLKAASVAVSNGRTFSLELIYYMLEHNELFPATAAPPPPPARLTRQKTSSTAVSVLTEENYVDEDDDDDDDDMHLAEQIIPFLIQNKVFIRISQPKTPDLTISPTPSTRNPPQPMPPPRPSKLMKQQEKINRKVRKEEMNRARSQYLVSEQSSRGTGNHFDFEAMAGVTVDEYDEDDDDDDNEYIPGNLSSKKKLEAPEEIVYYEFIAPIEQSTIYGLITDDQRKYFHERVASFYRESMLEMEEEAEDFLLDLPPPKPRASGGTTPFPPSAPVTLPVSLDSPAVAPSVKFSRDVTLLSGTISKTSSDDLWITDESATKSMRLKVNDGETPENLFEEGFHWEKANYWSTALRTYMRGAELEKARGNETGWISCLQHALRVFKTIEQEFYQGELPLMPNHKLPYPELIIKILLGQNTKDTDVVLYLKSVDKDMSHVFEVFEHDMDLIPLVCFLHLALADAYLLSWATLGEIATMAGVALKLLLFLRYQEIFHVSNSTNRRRHSSNAGFDHHSTSHRNLHGSFHHFHSVSSFMNTSNSNLTTPHNGVSPSSGNVMHVSFNYKDLFNTKSFQADPHHLISTLHIIHNTVMRYERPDDRDGTYYYYIAFKMGELIVDVDNETQNICLKAMKGLRQKDYLKVADTIAPLLSDSSANLMAKSAQRVRRFGVDLLPSIVSELAHSFFLTQEMNRFHELLEQPLYESLLRLPHLPSVENALLPILVLLTYSEDFRLYRKLLSACNVIFVDRKDSLVMIQGMFQEMVQCWSRSFLALYCPSDVPVTQRDKLTLSNVLMSMDMAEKLFESVQPDADPDEREMSNVEVKSLLRYGAAMESLALQMVCGLMLYVPTDEVSYLEVDSDEADAAASAAAAGPLLVTGALGIIAENDDPEAISSEVVEPSLVPERTGMLEKDLSFQQLNVTEIDEPGSSPAVALDPPSASYVDDLFSRWWDRMFTDLYTLRYLHILNILNPLLLLSRVLTKHQTNLTLPYTEARILLFYARFKTEIVHVCKKHKYLVAMEKFLAVETLFVERRKQRGGRVRSLSSPYNETVVTSPQVPAIPLGIGELEEESPTSTSSVTSSFRPPVPSGKRMTYRRTFTPRSLQEIIRTVEGKSSPAASNSAAVPKAPSSSTPGDLSVSAPSPSGAGSPPPSPSILTSPSRGIFAGRPPLQRTTSSKTWKKTSELQTIHDGNENEDDGIIPRP